VEALDQWMAAVIGVLSAAGPAERAGESEIESEPQPTRTELEQAELDSANLRRQLDALTDPLALAATQETEPVSVQQPDGVMAIEGAEVENDEFPALAELKEAGRDHAGAEAAVERWLAEAEAALRTGTAGRTAPATAFERLMPYLMPDSTSESLVRERIDQLISELAALEPRHVEPGEEET
jgi:hypothetical protein